MKLMLIVFVAFLAVAQTADFPEKIESNAAKKWAEFKSKHHKKYATTKEEQKRMKIFRKNQEIIDAHNVRYRLGNVTYSLAMNEFGDLRPDELAGWVTGLVKSQEHFGELGNEINQWQSGKSAKKLKRMLNEEVPLPPNVDWRNNGAVTSVKLQGSCGACWAFAAAGAVEAQHFKKTGNIRSLSAQNLLDCGSADGCVSGSYVSAFLYMMRRGGGIEADVTYPYEGVQRQCRFNPRNKYTNVMGYGSISPGEENLKSTVAKIGPTAVGVDATRRDFIFYSGGIHDDPGCSPEPGHAVLAIGYGTDANGVDYWIIKNSWGPVWGEGGYARMARNKDNQCGIASYGAYPVV